MKTIWLVNPYGPIEGEGWRDYSFNQFGKYLSKNNYKVIWWTSNFAHHFKTFRSEGLKDIQVNENFTIRLVPVCSYKDNFSLKRFLKDILFAKNCMKYFKLETQPNLIISADNPLTFGMPSFKFAKKYNVPIIYDQMDVWPEFMINNLGSNLRVLASILALPVFWVRKINYGNLDGVIALSKNYLTKAFSINNSLNLKPHEIIYNGVDINKFRTSKLDTLIINDFELVKNKNEIWCIFAGTLGPSYDIKTIMDSALYYSMRNDNKIKFIIAGSGPYVNLVKETESKVNNLTYLSSLHPNELLPLYSLCDVGLSTYTAKSNVDMPDKFYDYTGAGLAILNSLQGEVKDIIEENKIGINYIPGDVKSFVESLEDIVKTDCLDIYKINSKKVSTLFDENVQNEKLLKIVRKCINQ